MSQIKEKPHHLQVGQNHLDRSRYLKEQASQVIPESPVRRLSETLIPKRTIVSPDDQYKRNSIKTVSPFRPKVISDLEQGTRGAVHTRELDRARVQFLDAVIAMTTPKTAVRTN